MDIPYEIAFELFDLKAPTSEANILKAYKRLAKCAHPDKGGDEKLFCFITECKNVLLKEPLSSGRNSVQDPSNSTTHKSAKEDYYINLSDMYDIYYSLGRIQQKCNITDFRFDTILDVTLIKSNG